MVPIGAEYTQKAYKQLAALDASRIVLVKNHEIE